jgi:hypothetical protein
MVRWLLNDELEQIWKEIVVTYLKVLFQYSHTEELRGSTKNFGLDSCPGPYSNRPPSEYKSEVSRPDPTCWISCTPLATVSHKKHWFCLMTFLPRISLHRGDLQMLRVKWLNMSAVQWKVSRCTSRPWTYCPSITLRLCSFLHSVLMLNCTSYAGGMQCTCVAAHLCNPCDFKPCSSYLRH